MMYSLYEVRESVTLDGLLPQRAGYWRKRLGTCAVSL